MKTYRSLLVLIALSLVLSALAFVPALANGTPVVSEGYDPLAVLKAGVRYRNFSPTVNNGDVEVMIGTGGFGTYGGPYTTINFFPWKSTNGITFSYDQTAGKISTIVVANASYSKDYTVGDLAPLNYAQIYLKCSQAGTTVAFNNVNLAGNLLGSFSCPAGSQKNWMVTGVDLSGGFSLTGDLVMTGPNACRECNKLEIWVGYSVPPDDEGPVTDNVAVSPEPACLNGQATVTASVDDSTTGNSTIASAEYSLNGGDWTAMAATDGAFDEVSEDVTAGFTAAQIGDNTVCVRGTDALGNVGAEHCQDFVVTYVFDGFYAPIDMGVTNVSKAGQAIPAKWRLTDCAGVSIGDAASFVGLSSYPVSCTDLNGSPADAVEEYAPGNSGLQYNGDGYWQFNWKTPKTYAGTCRAMYVEFNSGTTSQTVYFQFK